MSSFTLLQFRRLKSKTWSSLAKYLVGEADGNDRALTEEGLHGKPGRRERGGEKREKERLSASQIFMTTLS